MELKIILIDYQNNYGTFKLVITENFIPLLNMMSKFFLLNYLNNSIKLFSGIYLKF